LIILLTYICLENIFVWSCQLTTDDVTGRLITAVCWSHRWGPNWILSKCCL